jgi:hypothetical protein
MLNGLFATFAETKITRRDVEVVYQTHLHLEGERDEFKQNSSRMKTWARRAAKNSTRARARFKSSSRSSPRLRSRLHVPEPNRSCLCAQNTKHYSNYWRMATPLNETKKTALRIQNMTRQVHHERKM